MLEVVVEESRTADMEVGGWDTDGLTSVSKGSFLVLAILPLRVLVALLFVLERWRGGGGGGADDDDELAGWVVRVTRLVLRVGSEEARREPGEGIEAGGRDWAVERDSRREIELLRAGGIGGLATIMGGAV